MKRGSPGWRAPRRSHPLMAHITLRSGIVARRHTLAYLREWARLQARALRHPRATGRWLALLNTNVALNQLASSHPQLVRKIYRPYLSLTFSCQDRLRTLVAHYDLMAKKGLMPLILSAASQPVVLAGVRGKSGVPLEISLLAVSPLDQEGELVLRLTHAGALVYSTAFSIVDEAGRSGRTVLIGCIQGPNDRDALGRIREASRELHGLRPKNLLVALVRQIGYDLGCRQMILIGNRNRAAHHSVRKGRVLADYDLLWREIGARAREDGNFQIPCENLPPSLEMTAIPSRKRSQVRRRYELLQSIVAGIRCRLGVPQLPPASAETS